MESHEREEDELQALQLHRHPHRPPVTQQTGCVDRARGESQCLFSSRLRHRVYPQGWSTGHRIWALLPPPSLGKGRGRERCLTVWTLRPCLRRQPRKVSHSGPECLGLMAAVWLILAGWKPQPNSTGLRPEDLTSLLLQSLEDQGSVAICIQTWVVPLAPTCY